MNARVIVAFIAYQEELNPEGIGADEEDGDQEYPQYDHHFRIGLSADDAYYPWSDKGEQGNGDQGS